MRSCISGAGYWEIFSCAKPRCGPAPWQACVKGHGRHRPPCGAGRYQNAFTSPVRQQGAAEDGRFPLEPLGKC